MKRSAVLLWYSLYFLQHQRCSLVSPWFPPLSGRDPPPLEGQQVRPQSVDCTFLFQAVWGHNFFFASLVLFLFDSGPPFGPRPPHNLSHFASLDSRLLAEPFSLVKPHAPLPCLNSGVNIRNRFSELVFRFLISTLPPPDVPFVLESSSWCQYKAASQQPPRTLDDFSFRFHVYVFTPPCFLWTFGRVALFRPFRDLRPPRSPSPPLFALVFP